MANLDEQIKDALEEQMRRKQNLERIKVIQKNQLAERPVSQPRRSKTGKVSKKGKAARQIEILERIYQVQAQAPERPAVEAEQGRTVVVPNLVGASPEQAAMALSQAGLRAYPQVEQMPGYSSQPQVISQSPAPGSEFAAGETVKLMVAVGAGQEDDRENDDDNNKGEDNEEGNDEGDENREGEPESKGEEGGEDGADEENEGQEPEEEGDGESPQDQLKDAAGEQVKDAAKEAMKNEAKAAAASAASSILAWFGAPAAVIGLGVVLIIFLVIFIFTVMIAGCNQTGLKGLAVKGASKIYGIFGGTDVCKVLAINTETAVQNAPKLPTSQPIGKLTDAQARVQLAAANIQVKHPESQTSLEGINQTTLTEIISLAKSCDAWARSTARAPNTATPGNACNIVVTGGTEGGHAAGNCSHGNGYKVDIGLNGTVNEYVMNSGSAQEGPIRGSDGARQFVTAGAIYALESNHWDIVVGCT